MLTLQHIYYLFLKNMPKCLILSHQRAVLQVKQNLTMPFSTFSTLILPSLWQPWQVLKHSWVLANILQVLKGHKTRHTFQVFGVELLIKFIWYKGILPPKYCSKRYIIFFPSTIFVWHSQKCSLIFIFETNKIWVIHIF